jgi:hypothetical protein
VTEVLPLLYLHGLSSSDFVPALGQSLGSAPGCRPQATASKRAITRRRISLRCRI